CRLSPMPEQSPVSTLRHVRALDGLRGIAVGVVVLHHAGSNLFPSRIAWLGPGGYLGVDIFFVLSGFLITTGLLTRAARGDRSLRHFYMRRAFRILPALVFLLGAHLVFTAFTQPQHFNYAVKGSVVAVLYGANMSPYPMSLLGHLWSLAIEEQFYFVMPIVF